MTPFHKTPKYSIVDKRYRLTNLPQEMPTPDSKQDNEVNIRENRICEENFTITEVLIEDEWALEGLTNYVKIGEWGENSKNGQLKGIWSGTVWSIVLVMRVMLGRIEWVYKGYRMYSGYNFFKIDMGTNKENYLEHLIPAPPVAAPRQQVSPEARATHVAWVKGQKKVDEEGQYVSSYVLKMKSYIDNLERLGHPVSLNLGMSIILVGLSKEYDSFVQNYNMHSMGKTVNELHAMIKLHEETLPKKVVAPTLHAIRARKAQKNKNKKPIKAAKGVQGKGKTKLENCPVYLAELLKKKKLSQEARTLGIFTIELYSFPSTSWVYDTGCGTHICNTAQGLRGSRKLKPGALSLYMGNGQRAGVEAIGSYHLCLPSGLVIVLNNSNYAPSITRGIILVLRLFDDGFINRFENNAISISMNNLVYFTAIPRDGIYEIDLSSSNTNDSSLYADYALESATRILNMVPTKKVEKTPYEIWHGQAPKLSYLKVWGCEALVKRDTLTKLDKLEPRSIKCIFVGYPNAEFFESNLIDQEAKDDQEIDEPQSDINPIHRSTRTRRSTDRLCLYINAEEHELGDLGEPANHKAALLDPKSDKWLNAMNVEMQSMKDNEVWELVDLPPD
ncbi:zinc finger, CCHC-type containing protein [Tanacetum coccineum]